MTTKNECFEKHINKILKTPLFKFLSNPNYSNYFSSGFLQLSPDVSVCSYSFNPDESMKHISKKDFILVEQKFNCLTQYIMLILNKEIFDKYYFENFIKTKSNVSYEEFQNNLTLLDKETLTKIPIYGKLNNLNVEKYQISENEIICAFYTPLENLTRKNINDLIFNLQLNFIETIENKSDQNIKLSYLYQKMEIEKKEIYHYFYKNFIENELVSIKKTINENIDHLLSFIS